ncbi:MAG: polyphosphate kinase 1 [Candidatus Merdivicinus sp.]|jgi:polyphosphate kinase
MEEINYRSCMQNRELSWLKFNQRVLEEANCTNTPLLERMHFVSIFTTNLDEFFMVRVGSLIDYMQYSSGYYDNKTGMTAAEQLAKIYRACAPLYALRDEVYERLSGQLATAGLTCLHMKDLSKADAKEASEYFDREIWPVLSPQIIDPSHPFPHLPNKTLNVAVSLEKDGNIVFGIIPIPAVVGRLFFLRGEEKRYLLVEDIICYFADRIFDQYRVKSRCVISVTRNADMDMDAGLLDEDLDYRQHMKKILKRRMRLAPVRLEYQGDISEEGLKYLRQKLGLEKAQVFQSIAPLDLTYCFALDTRLTTGMKKQLLLQSFIPQQSRMVNASDSMLRQVDQHDILLSYPYESMRPLLNLLQEAASDPEVVSIKITLYRIARQSVLAEHLIEAAENGKDVTVLMELRARFDEENNIEWAQRLEESGCQVIYGMEGFKVHSKICLITRRTDKGIRYITQIGTGNYNEKTAKLYTDLAILTANQQIGEDAAAFFRNLSLSNLNGEYHKLWVAPVNFKQSILDLTDAEIEKAKAGKEARIQVKCNSFTDRELIEKFIDASMAGVKIRLVIRGICCLTPQIPGMTDNIQIVSIVGRFLEHSRIYTFGVGEETKVFIASGDMMTRNTERRVEVACPIYDRTIKKRLLDMMDILLRDNVKAREQFADGRYILRTPLNSLPLNAQEYFMREALKPALEPEKSKVAAPVKRKGIFSFLHRGRK